MPYLSGFTYNGVHCGDLGLDYIPSKEDLGFSDPEFDVYEKDIEWRHGGVYFDSKARIRTFALKCYFEEIDVARRQAIKEWVRRDSNGMLVFDDMPFVYWVVRPADIPVGNWYIDNNEKHSGTVTIKFKAYEPFGYLIRKYNNGQNDGAEDYCNLIDYSDMPAAPTTSSTSFEVYNPGTEACGMSIELAGSTNNPFRFFNDGNGTSCVFTGLPGNNLRLEINGDTGFVGMHAANSTEIENGFVYHDRGIVRLDANYGKSNINYINGQLSGTEYRLDLVGYNVTNALRGARITLSNNEVLTVVSLNAANNRVWCTAEHAITLESTGVCSVMTVNKILVQEKVNNEWVVPTTLTLSYIEVDYKPRAL